MCPGVLKAGKCFSSTKYLSCVSIFQEPSLSTYLVGKTGSISAAVLYQEMKSNEASASFTLEMSKSSIIICSFPYIRIPSTSRKNKEIILKTL